jgi:hypothetical protein
MFFLGESVSALSSLLVERVLLGHTPTQVCVDRLGFQPFEPEETMGGMPLLKKSLDLFFLLRLFLKKMI